ncbi:MAG: PQQ-binding-like beta-propeller repeat protein [Gammaproteobacteria bacterium]|nr:PQQ-binding-like beta-propeller repeat protein [Gammaproteobacteria bacterium]
MNAMHMNKVCATVLLSLALNGCSEAADRTHPLTSLPTSDWVTNGGNVYNQRYSPLTQINRDNVAGLKGEWMVHLDGSGTEPRYSGEAQPLVENGIVYIVTGADDVFALKVEDGSRLWKYEAHLDQSIDSACCGWLSRGVGLSEDKIFVGQLDGRLVALDKATGQEMWNVQAERWQAGFTITGAPLYYDGLVYVGFAGGERGIRGRFKAFDAKTGELVWTFYTVPGPGELGHDTWPQDSEAWKRGGAPVWQTPAVDPELGLLYFSTGNASPDYNGSQRPGDNLFAASILALELKTGKYRWHFQQVHHDIWDYDSPNPIILFELEYNGKPRKGLAQASKTGWVYLLDRETGEPLIGIEEKPVPQDARMGTAATQPYPIGDAFVPQSVSIAPEGYKLINEGRIFTPYYTDEFVLATPGVAGGANWPPSAFDPTTGHMFICAADRAWAFRAEPLGEVPPPEGSNYVAGVMGGFPLGSTGVVAAMDLHTNRLVWQYKWPEPCFSGMTATAGGVVFVGRNDGRLTALDTRDGAKLWEFQTGAGMNAPVTTFEYKGKQYVIGLAAGALLAPSKRGDNLWLFSLDGKLDQVSQDAAAPSASAPAVAAPAVADGDPDIENGRKVYMTACVACHGDEGKGGHGGGISLENASDYAAIVDIVSTGRKDMPPLAAAIGAVNLRDVAAFVSQTFAKH